MQPEELFQTLYAEHAPHVYAYFNVCFGFVAAQDATQQVFLKLWQRINDARYTQPPQNWKAWIFRVAINEKNTHFRRQYAQEALQTTTPPATGDTADWAEQMGMRHALSHLPQAQRTLLLLHANGFSSLEIAQLLNCNASTVRSRLQRARQHLQQQLLLQGVNGNVPKK